MGEEDELDIPAGRSHIIERPRLTRLLDETSARVIMLVAPAGYGKTTLARQWLSKRPHAWYQGGAASADLAALGLGIAGAAANVTKVGHRFREWLPTRRGSEGANVAADFLADDLENWPADAWLAIDDYQWLTTEAEEVLDRLTHVPGFRLLLTSRRWPIWATPRKLLYGELYELGQNALAMSLEEANEVLTDMEGEIARGLLALANGWPAVIGLAAFADAPSFLHRDQIPPALHDYVAEELYASVAESNREALSELSLLPSLSAKLAKRLLRARSAETLSEGLRVGFLTGGHGSTTFELHPLLRAFLRRKLADLPQDHVQEVIARATKILLSETSWEGAFDLISQFDRVDLLDDLLRASLYDLLNQGLLSTVAKFVGLGQAQGVESPVLDLAKAELAFRQGFHERARALAHRAGDGLRAERSLASKAFCRAGQSAYFSEDPQGAIELFSRARDLATDLPDKRSAIWGQFIAAVELGYDHASELLSEFERTGIATIDDAARIQNGRLHLATRMGHLSEGLAGAQSVANLVQDAEDPIVRASFWHVYAGALRAAAFYANALDATDNALVEIDTFHLAFAKAHVFLTRAGIKLGLGHYDEALLLLDQVEQLARGPADIYLLMNERTTRCRVHLLEGRMEQALSVTDCSWPQVPSSGQYAEFLACRAIALTELGNEADAIELIGQAERISKESEASNLCTWARAIHAFHRDPSRTTTAITSAFEAAIESGMVDPFVFAYRLEEGILQCLAAVPMLQPPLTDVLLRVGDSALLQPLVRTRGREPLFAGIDDLTRREREVFALLAESKSNKEIAAILFLSEATVKVHVRHILHKLGVRTRTAAAVRAAKMQQRRALAATDRSDPSEGQELQR
jgi:ATP/maltotriose-dependent transcriptional regulator MalT